MLEAMAMRVPVITRDIGIVPDVIQNDVNGFVINEESNLVEAFSSKIVEVLSKHERHKIVGQRARDTVVGRFSFEMMGAHYSRLFREMLLRSA